MNLRKIASRVTAAITAAVMVITNLPASTVFADVGSWTTTDGGDTYNYTQGADPTAAISSFSLAGLQEFQNISDWSTIQYISVDVEASSTVQPVICGNLDSVWTNGNPVWMENGGENTVYYETNGKTCDGLGLQFWPLDWNTGTIAAANTTITISNITFSENDMPDPVGVWFEKDGAKCYQNGSSNSSWVSLDLIQYANDNSISWTDTKYISATVECVGEGAPNISMNFTGDDTGWEGTDPVQLNNSSAELVFATDGRTPNSSYGGATITFETLPANTLVKISNIVFHDTYQGIKNVWYKDGDSWYYQNGDSDIISNNTVGSPTFDLSSVTDWSAIKYISAEVTTAGKANPCFGGTVNGNWTDGDGAVFVNNDTVTIYWNTNGEVELDGLYFNLWDCDGVFLAANQLIKISNLKFSTDPMPDPVGEWYEKDGVWYYQNGDSAATGSFDPLEIDTSSVTDWSAIKYISAEVTTAGKANPCFGGTVTNGSWTISDSSEFVDNGTVTVYWNTNGEVELDKLYLYLWDSDGVFLAANQLIKISNLKFSTDPMPDPVGEWYEKDGVWYYQNGNSVSGWVGFDFIQYASDNSLSWADTEYISATVECSEEMTTYLSVQFPDDSWKEDSAELGITSAELGCATKGETPKVANIAFGNLPAGTLIKISNIKFSEETPIVYDQWYEASHGVWKYVDSGNGYQDGDSNYPLVFNDYMDIDLTGAKYVSAKVTVDGMAVTGFNGNNDNGTHHKGGSYVENVDRENTSYFFCYEGGYTSLSYGLWNIGKGTTITLSDLQVSTTDLTNYTNITGQVVQIGENSYYFKNSGQTSENIGSDLQLLPDDVDISAAQTISMKIKGIRSGTGINLGGWTAENRLVQGYPFPTIDGEYVVERKYRGWIARSPILSVYTDKYDEVYISDIIYDKTPIETVYTNPNDVLIYDNVTVITHEDISHRIELVDLSKMEVPGTLKVKVELIDGYDDPYIQPNFSDWGDSSYTPEMNWAPIIPKPVKLTEDCYFEFRMEQKYIDLIQHLWSQRYVDGFGGSCTLHICGYGITVSDVIFTPDPTVEKPRQEEITADKVTQEDKQELENSKNNTHNEKDAKDKATNGKIQGHKYHKKDKNGRDVYSLRIVKMVDKKLLQHAENVTITVYSKKADKYVTFTADCCFSYLNIYGEKVKAGGDHAFLTVIVDNIHDDDEITFTDFTINYKK